MLIHISDLSTVYIYLTRVWGSKISGHLHFLGFRERFFCSENQSKSVSRERSRPRCKSVSRSEGEIFRLGSNIYTLICNQLPLVSSHGPYYINDLTQNTKVSTQTMIKHTKEKPNWLILCTVLLSKVQNLLKITMGGFIG